MCFRLPFPWLLYGLIYGKPYEVSSKGLFCSILLLFIMLILVIVMIAVFKWKMNKTMGISMFVGYAIFLSIALLLELNIVNCPVWLRAIVDQIFHPMLEPDMAPFIIAVLHNTKNSIHDNTCDLCSYGNHKY